MKISKLFLLFFTGLLVACQNTGYENVFEESPSERRQEFFEKFHTTLTSSDNGWVIQYFIMPESVGYNIIAVFDPSGSVKMGAKHLYTNNVYQEYTSKYETGIETGPMLSFVTYNTALFPFCDPDINRATFSDFEFSIQEVTDDLILMRGKKSEAEIWMKRLPANTTGEEYVLQAEGMKNFLFSPTAPDLQLHVGEKSFIIANGYSSIFTINEIGNDTAEFIPIITTPEGFRLYKSFEVGDVAIRSFRLNEKKDLLICNENTDIQISGYDDIADYFVKNITSVWTMDVNNLSPQVFDLFRKIEQSSQQVFGASNMSLAIAHTTGRNSFSLRLSFLRNNSIIQGNIDLPVSYIDKNKISFTYTANGDNNGIRFIEQIDGIVEMAQLLATSFTLNSNSIFNPANIKFTKEHEPDVWFQAIK